MPIDYRAYPHIVDTILRACDYSTILAWRATSRHFRFALHDRFALEHLTVDTRGRRRRPIMRNKQGLVPSAFADWDAQQDFGLGWDWGSDSDDSEYFPPGCGRWGRGDYSDPFSDETDSATESDSEDGDELARRAAAELREVEACPRCQEWEAAILAQLPQACAQADEIARYVDAVELYEKRVFADQQAGYDHDWDQEALSDMHLSSEYQSTLGSRPTMPVLQPLSPDPDELADHDGHAHAHETANMRFWAAQTKHVARRKEAFARAAAKVRVLDVPGAALLHGLEAFTGLEVIRYVGQPNLSPAWVALGAPIVVRFLDLTPAPGRWWEPTFEPDCIAANDVWDVHHPRSSSLCHNRLDLYRPMKKMVVSITYHPEHALMPSSIAYTENAYLANPQLEHVVVILVPSTKPAPSCPMPSKYSEGHPYNCKAVCRLFGGVHHGKYGYGPATLIVEQTMDYYCRFVDSYFGVRPRPHLTVVGLVELGNAAIDLHGDGTEMHYEGDVPFATLSTAERIYARATRHIKSQQRWDFEWSRAAQIARDFMRLLSLDEYRNEVGEEQFRLETVPPSVPTTLVYSRRY
ncbi:hypothetical protein CC85DRAFT_281809 [Cutaneotrichosporon oleaginosum]|uniref:F-box domain-containing protein n=1 Tax=Cutaneotrichosporon oleaginosum TaxID=879819 RepID=A0A0J0XYM3_9TREE|nr:uncharacterized protein CC85DRAFT_281809 [Cutaneotrichosporon oleaginosum]KLT46157.1 hypothetical protein CC85DRAFT_281809 [Cutaneotrichosporon oleaginosum]TXT10167.1 hypothetical protein COLE_04101 [Cutaneotrichosporon oleaginosum]